MNGTKEETWWHTMARKWWRNMATKGEIFEYGEQDKNQR
jgi:hypothetical protein